MKGEVGQMISIMKRTIRVKSPAKRMWTKVNMETSKNPDHCNLHRSWTHKAEIIKDETDIPFKRRQCQKQREPSPNGWG